MNEGNSRESICYIKRDYKSKSRQNYITKILLNFKKIERNKRLDELISD